MELGRVLSPMPEVPVLLPLAGGPGMWGGAAPCSQSPG